MEDSRSNKFGIRAEFANESSNKSVPENEIMTCRETECRTDGCTDVERAKCRLVSNNCNFAIPEKRRRKECDGNSS